MHKWQVALPSLTATVMAAMVTVMSGTIPLAAQGNAADAKCWTDWSEAALIVRRETLMPVERVGKLARDRHPGAEVIKVTLCEVHGKFVYRFILRERQGQLKTELLDARQSGQ